MDEFKEKIIDSYKPLSAELYDKYNVQRGLRHKDGTGVMAGLTAIGDVKGYVIEDGEKTPREGRLRYRGIDVRELVEGCQREGRFGFEEVAFLLLSGFCRRGRSMMRFLRCLASIVRCRTILQRI